ncbi:gamma-glutamyl phosphate reductase [Planococcus antarcticus DSM 14505]|uniref:Gamma-glutamyl phosphate reductase n=1 Tax=Planococcus antarcticus DSM 14505 TaxID=1185653 RepID=A0A1C7DFU8_9BACL|nr:glutamate-5-semialdehyde dehydrogenase [Planococcus antarcticus]ANU10141.1 glutamate-5-semialdehyde dehydrogenase [Planococcus antarcticus DSM 14505]EIM06216.1 gamma-glutamyl phosphate reductase [Planococcus antarcticus DSM 14505]
MTELLKEERMTETELIVKAQKAKEAAFRLAKATTQEKNEALQFISAQLLEEQTFILDENAKDVLAGREAGMDESLVDRLTLDAARLKDMADALIQLTRLDDPIGEVLEKWQQPNGLSMTKIRVPIGVVGMIYEARPNVTVDASSLCLKTGNAIVLRGSSTAINSNKAIVQVIRRALEKTKLPVEAVQLIEDTRRETASKMFKLNDYLDVLIPRGGAKLIQTVVQNATVPVLETGAGNCHLYIDQTADVKMALDIAINAKTQRPSVCNSCETILVHKEWAAAHLPELVTALGEHDVKIHGDGAVQQVSSSISPATEEDWAKEYLGYEVAIKVVETVDEAVQHINRYGTKHSEAIISTDARSVEQFFNEVDAAAVYHNASTRFTDGYEFGFGAEIGISTQKLHARGPMGLPALTSTKYIVRGNGQTK